MGLKLDELRKRLQQNTASDLAVSGSTHHSSSHGVSAPEIAVSEPPSATDAEVVKQREASMATIGDPNAAAPRPAQWGNSHVESAGSARNGERKTSRRDEPIEEPVALFRRPTASAAEADPSGQYQLADAVAKVFEQTKAFQARFDQLARKLAKLERIGEDAALVFEPLRAFHEQLAQLAASFEPMRAFQAHLAELADSFEPMKVLHDQVAELADSFHQHLAQLVKVLDPAKDFRDRILALAHSFDEGVKLQTDFGQLYAAFRSSGPTAAEPVSNGSRPPAGLTD